jgi:hypothetical protein
VSVPILDLDSVGGLVGGWTLSGSSDRAALDLVDGTGPWAGAGPHYSRRTPGSRTFTGVGQEIVLVHPSGAVWAVVRARVPSPVGSGASRGRDGTTVAGRYVWRCNMFRNLGPERASDLVRSATTSTVRAWLARYGEVPSETLQTEVKPAAIHSEVPGYCYRRAGWVSWRRARGLVILRCPRVQIERAAPLLANRVVVG